MAVDVVVIPGVLKWSDRDTIAKLKEYGLYKGLVYIEFDFNIDTQVYDMAIRSATIEDI